MLRNLPEDKILLETDCPYLGPEKGVRNEPATVSVTVDVLAKERNMSIDEARSLVWKTLRSFFAVAR